MTTLQESAMRLALAALTSTDALPYEDWMRASGHPAIKALNAALAQQGEQQPVCHGCGIPAGDVHMSTCKSGKWPSRVSNGDTAAPAPQPQAQPAQELTGCACRWDADDKRVATCVRHQGWLDVVSEWAERAKAAESQQAQPERAPLSEAELEQEFCKITGLETGINPAAADTKRALVWFKKGYAHGIKQGGQ